MKTKIKAGRVLIGLLTAVILFTLFSVTALAAVYRDGTFTGEGKGFGYYHIREDGSFSDIEPDSNPIKYVDLPEKERVDAHKIRLSVTLDGGAMTDIEVLSHHEFPESYITWYGAQFIQRILDA